MYSDTGEFAKAKDYHERALEIRKEQLGPNHVDVATLTTTLVMCIAIQVNLQKLRIIMNGPWKFKKNN